MPAGQRKPQQPGGFGAALRASRAQASLSQEQLAERAGLSVRTIAYLERGQVRPRPATLQLLADALGLDGLARTRFAAAALALDDGHGPDTPVAAAAARLPVTPAQLPADVAGFTGRAEHLRQLDGLLPRDGEGRAAGGQARTVVISAIGGTAGVGKTALAVHWAHRVADRFPDGQLHVNLHGWSSSPPVQPVQALAQLLGGLGVEPDKMPVELDQAAGLYRSLLASRRVLVVLDNARDPEQVRPLLPGSPSCLVVVTSRDRLVGLVGSHGARPLALDVLSAEEAVDLLGEIIGQQRLASELEAAAELAEVCGCLPLALRIAAANLACHPDWSLAGYLARLRGGNRLAELAVDGDPQAAVAVAFDSSYAALQPEAQRLFRLLGMVPGADFSPQAAAALAGLPVGQAELLLERLAGAHLVEPRGAGRFGFHDLLRLYARQRSEREERDAERQRAVAQLLDWYLHIADTADRLLYPEMLRLPVPAADHWLPAAGFDDHAGALGWLDSERANLVASVRHAAEHGPRPVAWLLADALRAYFRVHQHMVDWLAVAEIALGAAMAAGGLQAQSACTRSLGMAHKCLGDYAEATKHFTEALLLARQAGWVEGEASALTTLGLAYDDQGKLQLAADYLAQALALHRRTGRKAGQATALGNLGGLSWQMGKLQQAVDELTEALALDQEVGSKVGQATWLANLGYACRELGRLDDAAELLSQALAVAREVGNRYGEAADMYALAAVHREAGRLGPALELAETAVALTDELGDPRVEADALSTLGSVELCLGRPEQAAEHHERALQLARRTRARYPETEALLGLAAVRRRQGCHAQAVEHAQHALALARDGAFQILEGRAHATLAGVQLDLDHDREAAKHAQQAVTIQCRTGHRLGQADALVTLGHIRRRAGDLDGARGCWCQALALLTETGAVGADQVRALLDTR